MVIRKKFYFLISGALIILLGSLIYLKLAELPFKRQEKTSTPIISTSSNKELIIQTSTQISEQKEKSGETKIKKEYINKDGSIFSFEFSVVPNDEYSEGGDVKIKIYDKKTNSLIQEFKVDCNSSIFRSEPHESIEFFDLDKNGFIDFVLKDCWTAAYNWGDMLFLFDPETKKYNKFSLMRPDYDLKNSLITERYREGMDYYAEYISKVVDGRLIPIRDESYVYPERLKVVQEFKDGKWITLEDYVIELKENACFYIERKMINNELKPMRISKYFNNKEGVVVEQYQKFNEKGETIENLIREVKSSNGELVKGINFNTEEDCKNFVKAYSY